MISKANRPRVVFTVTTGRSGTGYLADVLAVSVGSRSVHEPRPSFVDVMRGAQARPEWASRFIREVKWPAILERTGGSGVHVETTHLFCKGFFDPWLQITELPVPDLILLDRDHRKTALSLLSLETVPGRTEKGLKWYLSSEDPGLLIPLPNPDAMNDYQICYWYCLEIEKRKEVYAKAVLERGGRVARASTEDLKHFPAFRRLLLDLNLPLPSFKNWLRYFKKRHRIVNSKGQRKKSVPFQPDELDRFEKKVEEAVSGN